MALRFRRGRSHKVQLFHLSTVASPSSYPASADITTVGGLFQLDRHAFALEGGTFGDLYDLMLDESVAVRVRDKVILDGDTSNVYYVKKIYHAPRSRVRRKRCTISSDAKSVPA